MPILKKREIDNLEQMTSEELEEFLKKLPVGQFDIEDLFDFLEIKLEKEECNHSLRYSMQFIMENRLGLSETNFVASAKRRLLRLQSHRTNRSGLAQGI